MSGSQVVDADAALVARVVAALATSDGFTVDGQLRRQAAAADLDDLALLITRCRRRRLAEVRGAA